MQINEADDNMLLEELAERGIKDKEPKDFDTDSLISELARRVGDLELLWKRPHFQISEDHMGNVIINHSQEEGMGLFFQFESDKDAVYELLREPERMNLESGGRVDIWDQEPRASVFAEMWDNGLGLGPMKDYRVLWEIDIQARSPLSAAKEAQKIQRDPDSIATVFQVYVKGETAVNKIDLAEGD